MIKIIKKINRYFIKNKKNILSIFIISIFFVFIVVKPVEAKLPTLAGGISSLLGWICAWIIAGIGYLLTFLIKILVNVANFNNIIDVPAVKNGWVVVRDLCNMFFVLILLIIAFATILKQENYSAKRLLPKLLIMAVLINFSRTIFGLIIDFSQVIMSSFVSGFGGKNASAYIIDAFQINKMQSINDNVSGVDVGTWGTSIAVLLGLVAILIAFVVVVVMLAVLLMRIIMLWLYTVLSPLVFLGFAFPPLQKYTGQIWQDFIKQVITGPMLAFFLWLALTTAGSSSVGITEKLEEGNEITGGINALFAEENFSRFIIVIGMFIGGLMVTQQVGGAVGSIAGKGMAAVQGKYGPTPMRWGRDRLEAFQGLRTAKRKEKVSKFGQKMYGHYTNIASAPKNMIKAGTGATLNLMKGSKENIDISKRKKAKQEKSKARKNINEAYEHFNENKNETEKVIGDYMYVKNKKGGVDVKTKDGKEEIKGAGMSKFGIEYRQGYNRMHSPARQIIDKTTKSKVDEIKNNFSDLSSSELRKVLTDAFSSKDEKTAASMMIANKDAFKNKKQMDLARTNVEKSPSLLKEFNELNDKRFGQWNNSPDEFKAKVDAGVINLKQLDTKQLEDGLDLIIQTAGDEFKDVSDAIGKRSKDSKEKLIKAMENKIGKYTKVDMNDNNERRLRNSYASTTGKIDVAFGNNDTERIKFVKNAKTNEIDRLLDDGNISVHHFVKDNISNTQADRYKKAGDKSAAKSEKLDLWINERNKKEKKDEAKKKVNEDNNKWNDRNKDMF